VYLVADRRTGGLYNVSSISSTSPVITNLLQTLSNAGSTLAQTPAVLSALEKASPTDIAELSESADRLAEESAIFGEPTVPTSASDGGNAVLQIFQTALTASADSASANTPLLDLLG
jgi:hypothetical protein